MTQEIKEIKATVKMELGGVLAINPTMYGKYLDGLASRFDITRDEARDIAKEALSELPPYMD